MAEECTGNSVATSSPNPLNWWDLHASPLPSWNNSSNAWTNPPNPNSSSSCEEDISVSTSFTNASNHSSLTVESSRRLVERPAASSNELMAEHASDNQLWSHVLLGAGENGELHNNHEVGENFLDALSSKSMTSAMFEPACDYLKKLDTSWDYSSNSASFNSFEKHLNGFSETMIESERLTKLSNLVSTWSIAPPDPEVNSHQFDHQSNDNISLSNSMDHYPQTDPCQIKQPFGDSSWCSNIGASATRNSGIFPCYDLDMKVKQESEVPGAVFTRSYNAIGYQDGVNSPVVGNNGQKYFGMPNLSSCARNFADVISFTSRLGRPIIGIHAPKPSIKSISLSDSKKQGLQASSPTKSNNGRVQKTTSEIKKKRSDDSSEAMVKKSKQDASSSTKVQAPKVKLGDKITALQQIVSPFGKTDTASVLFEAIGYIKFLQEQVQLLSNPYLKTNSLKDPWGSLDRKEKGDAKADLRSRGLCLVPISCAPQVYRDNSGPDYWTPAYRGCLYR